jgi:hypothetical protein
MIDYKLGGDSANHVPGRHYPRLILKCWYGMSNYIVTSRIMDDLLLQLQVIREIIPSCSSCRLIMRIGTRNQVLMQAAFTVRQRPILPGYASSTASTASGLRSFHSSQPKLSRIPDRNRRSEKNTPRYSTPGGFISGKWFCDCGRPAVHLEVKKSGRNKGMKCKFSLADFTHSLT